MEPRRVEVEVKVAGSFKYAFTAVMASLSVALSFIQIPFPLAPFLKYDLAGIPLLILSLALGLKWGYLADLVLFLSLLRGGDPIGAFMKFAAEALTFTPMAIIARPRALNPAKLKRRYIAGSLAAGVSRVGGMVLLNYLIDPLWLVLFYRLTWVKAYELTLALIIPVAIFNASIAAIYLSLTYPTYTTLLRRFRWLTNA